jgi:hypothetical protein
MKFIIAEGRFEPGSLDLNRDEDMLIIKLSCSLQPRKEYFSLLHDLQLKGSCNF